MSVVSGALSPSSRPTVAVGGPGDVLVMCPAEGDSSGATKELAAGPVSLPLGIKAGNILPLMTSDSFEVKLPAQRRAAQQVAQKGQNRRKLNFNMRASGCELFCAAFQYVIHSVLCH